MRTIAATFLSLVFIAASATAGAATWEEGKHYVLIPLAHPVASNGGKVQVVEVFSYACPACNMFHTIANRLRAELPKNAELNFVAAGFRADEDWPMFQRAFYTAQVLGIDKKTHDAIFDAVWKTGELATVDPRNGQIRQQLPTIEDAARVYAKVAGINADTFVTTAKSFGVDFKVRQAEDYIHTHRVDHTPTIIVADRYQTDANSAGGYDQLIELVKWLIAREGH
jgi:thiol:disulfide interchange protein DsbA